MPSANERPPARYRPGCADRGQDSGRDDGRDPAGAGWLSAALLDWFDTHGRHDLPWQRAPTPYRVWVSEIMLQQTRVGVVIPYFERFMARFPDLSALADAPLDAVLAHWSGLGYYARARNLHRAAMLMRDRHGGVFPDDFAAVAALPGIGRSTAGAILSLALGQPHAILDGNVRRVLARCFAVDGWPGQARVQAALWALAERHLSPTRPGAHNQALMDLGATLCTRAAPACGRCPLAARCLARMQGRQDALPAPRPRGPVPERATLMLVVVDADGNILLERRPPAGIWGGLWSLPEAPPETDPADWCETRLGRRPARIEHLAPRRHGFSHFTLDIRIVTLRLAGTPPHVADAPERRWLDPGAVAALGLPAPVRSILDALGADGL